MKDIYYPDKCSWCGKFIGENDFENGATYKFTPDSEYTSEGCEFTCIKCNKDK